MNWKSWAQQAGAVARVELRKYRRGRRWILLLALATFPNLLLLTPVIPDMRGGFVEMRRLPINYAVFFQDFWLRFVIFFSCAVMFSQTFRGEFLEKTLHYYFLVPVRREIVVMGKYLTALASSVLLFSISTASTYLLFFWPSLRGRDFLLSGLGIQHMWNYLAIVILACTAYGALFLFIGLVFRNPMIPAIFVLLWESFNYVLPQSFQRLSVTLYLQSFMPVTFLKGAFGITTQPPSPAVCAAFLLAVSALILTSACVVLRRIQVTYSVD